MIVVPGKIVELKGLNNGSLSCGVLDNGDAILLGTAFSTSENEG